MEPNQNQNLSGVPQVPQSQSSIGSIVGTIIIIAIIILGGLYFWGKRIEENKLKQNLVTGTTSEEISANEATAIKSVSSGDDITSIEADLNNTNLNNLGAEMNVQAQ